MTINFMDIWTRLPISCFLTIFTMFRNLLSLFRVLLTALLDTDAVVTGDWSDLAVPGLSLLQNFNWLELVGD